MCEMSVARSESRCLELKENLFIIWYFRMDGCILLTISYIVVKSSIKRKSFPTLESKEFVMN